MHKIVNIENIEKQSKGGGAPLSRSNESGQT
jgi:hypothetical protein